MQDKTPSMEIFKKQNVTLFMIVICFFVFLILDGCTNKQKAHVNIYMPTMTVLSEGITNVSEGAVPATQSIGVTPDSISNFPLPANTLSPALLKPTLTPTPTSTPLPITTLMSPSVPTSSFTPTPGIEALTETRLVPVREGCGSVFSTVGNLTNDTTVKITGLGEHNSLKCYLVQFTDDKGQSLEGWVWYKDVEITIDESLLPKVTLPYTAVNDFFIMNEDSSGTIDIFQNDYGPIGNRNTLEIISYPKNGEISVDATTGTITYLPTPDFYGDDAFGYRVLGANGNWSEAAVTVSVEAINDRPLIMNNGESFKVRENSSKLSDVMVAAIDIDNNDLIYQIIDGNTNNAFSIDSHTGRLQVNNQTALDFEITHNFNLKISVSDGYETTEGLININLENIVETARILVTIDSISIDTVIEDSFSYVRFNMSALDANQTPHPGYIGFPNSQNYIDMNDWETKHVGQEFEVWLQEDQLLAVDIYGLSIDRDNNQYFIGAIYDTFLVNDLGSDGEFQSLSNCVSTSRICDSPDVESFTVDYTVSTTWFSQ